MSVITSQLFPEMVRDVYNIFKEFFKEEFVDLQQEGSEYFILVFFPSVTVTNEYNKSIDIQDLYVKVRLAENGSMIGKFAMNRATYPIVQYLSNYMHSHVCSIPTSNRLEFQVPCTGSGPINSTIANLNREYDENIWNLFCLELSRYVTVESIAGGPYHRLESIGADTSRLEDFRLNHQDRPNRFQPNITASAYRGFVTYLIKSNVLKFKYVNGCYQYAFSDTDLAIVVSNAYIDWVNKCTSKLRERSSSISARQEDIYNTDMLRRYIYSNGNVYNSRSTSTIDSAIRSNGEPLWTFKGRRLTLSILGDCNINLDNTVLLLDRASLNFILSKVLTVVNYIYGTKDNNTEVSSNEKIYFI